MKNNLQKIEAIQRNPKQLKAGESKIEQKRINIFFQVLKAKEAFQIDFYALVGGILEAIDTVRSEPAKMEAWRVIGKKLRKSRLIRGRQKRVKNSYCRDESGTCLKSISN